MLKLIGARGGGSAVVEALLRLANTRYECQAIAWDDAAAWRNLEVLNPQKQIPILVTPEGEVLTESAAILMWIVARNPQSRLAPEPGSAVEGAFYRWLVFLATNVYASIVIGDFPARWVEGDDAQQNLKARCTARVKSCWVAMESCVTPAPFLLGERMTALDVYAAMMSRWRPGRAWFAEHCPKITDVIARTEAHPIVAEVWARNFD